MCVCVLAVRIEGTVQAKVYKVSHVNLSTWAHTERESKREPIEADVQLRWLAAGGWRARAAFPRISPLDFFLSYLSVCQQSNNGRWKKRDLIRSRTYRFQFEGIYIYTLGAFSVAYGREPAAPSPPNSTPKKKKKGSRIDRKWRRLLLRRWSRRTGTQAWDLGQDGHKPMPCHHGQNKSRAIYGRFCSHGEKMP